MALALVYDPRYHDFESWGCLMCEAYAGQQLSIPDRTTDWKEWAASLKGIDLFANEGFPGPYSFDEWQDWAAALVGAVNQPTN
ncbi:hypothetical protein UFOVP35_35 [uncultured Caudovirales phage]|uniref:Uncharacterized protein n=1 Tax=uncultured Caudovirales phage TaxID=2100421 RepID=A0A6J7WT20_9CAUD|nr:hypothetical protein UFOVP35_35 [uncultured Caudovirales phage]CAB4124412.1 hypothetical protein UFOVP52_12 [uncultured Caudovirales phage]CAB5219832.1 hypothetical protein UFOVP234_37 [uncultured Caudovirales phage]